MGSMSPPSSLSPERSSPASMPEPKSIPTDSSQLTASGIKTSELIASAIQTQAPTPIQTPSSSVDDLRNQLHVREQEIKSLKTELDRYKLLLTIQEHQKTCQPAHTPIQAGSSVTALPSSLLSHGMHHQQKIDAMEAILEQEDPEVSALSQVVDDDNNNIPRANDSDIINVGENLVVVESIAKESIDRSSKNLQKGQNISGKLTKSCQKSVVFRTYEEAEDNKVKPDNIQRMTDTSERPRAQSLQEGNDHDDLSISDASGQDEFEDIIQDVGEINLCIDEESDTHPSGDGRVISNIKSENDSCLFNRDDKKLESDVSTRSSLTAQDEEAISDGLLLTSLTDAAINNLSQLAALQERCESQQQHSHHRYQSPAQSKSSCSMMMSNPQSTSVTQSISATPDPNFNTLNVMSHHQTHRRPRSSNDFMSDLFPSQAGVVSHGLHRSSTPSHGNITRRVQSIGMPTSVSCVSTPLTQTSSANIQSTTDLSTANSQSLASVVAAAAVAAAAANDQNPTSIHQVNPQHRMISSPEFYQLLHQHYSSATGAQHHQTTISPASMQTYSPNTCITPSSASSMIGPQSSLSSVISSSMSRRSVSAASSNILSPIASPNYLRQQFIDRLPMLSPTPGQMFSSTTGCAVSSVSTTLSYATPQQRCSSSLSVATTSPTPLSTSIGSAAVIPSMSNKHCLQARLNNMQIRHKFGYLGSNRGQFNSPHGFCLGLNQEIVVADTNNHRVCIFDKSGTYLTQFGTPGKEEGQLWNPRKVAILHKPTHGFASGASGGSGSSRASPAGSPQQQIQPPSAFHLQQQSYVNSQPLPNEPLYVVCDRGSERSRMQIFTKTGTFIKKIGIQYIDIVAGLAITQNGLIIVVDSVSPTVYIINGDNGILDRWFDCSSHMKEPSDIAVKSDCPGNEYFICDFKGHCVVVFSERGEYLRQIGQDGLTSYPNGIDISDDGDILVGDSHGNRFHVVVFDRNGNFVSQFECPHVKVSRCCGLKITREGYIVTLAKNNHHVLVLDTIHI